MSVSKQQGKRLEHQGIRIEFVGQIELFNDKSNTHEFVNLVKELALPGELPRAEAMTLNSCRLRSHMNPTLVPMSD